MKRFFDKRKNNNIFSRPAPSIQQQIASGLDPSQVVIINNEEYVVEPTPYVMAPPAPEVPNQYVMQPPAPETPNHLQVTRRPS